MIKILNKPYTNREYADFADNANKNGAVLVSTEDKVYALKENEILQNGEIVDISGTPEYIAAKNTAAVQKRIDEIKSELNELDKKRIRAYCEPEVKDPATGETWLEYYNSQITNLREELTGLI